MKSNIVFADARIKAAFNKLRASKTESKMLHEFMLRAFDDLEKDAFCGIQIPKNLIPKEYEKRYGKLNNLWKYNLPNAWRLIYTIKTEEVLVLSVVLEWMDHKNYERRFGY
ncbi:MAG: hypothetical protein QT00_C0001G0150 [archaeon GW2011_AR5]|nr:MAG: hypothetical protein QT00_C0001G0150 [archaeon GW2011_AR5]